MTPDFPTWGSDNPSVATVTTQHVHGVAAGSTSAWASGWISEGNASYCTVVHEQPTASVTVLSANLTLNTSGQVSATDEASNLYKGIVNTLNLGVLAGQLGTNNGCVIGNELVGAIQPNDFPGPATVKRTLNSAGCYQGSTSVACPVTPPADETGDMYTTNPQEVTPGGPANGNVYNLDTPGVLEVSMTTPVGVRFNFTAYVVGPDGSTKISPDLNYFVRISCKNGSSGVAQLSTDVSSDNQIGTGTTKTTWNLQ